MVRRIGRRGRTRRQPAAPPAFTDARRGLLLCAAGTAAALLARHHLHGLAEVAPAPAAAPVEVDVVVPARDEAGIIGACVTALRPQTRAAVTVVDDGSTDLTATLAGRAGAAVLSVAGPPPGWMGKPHACATGAAAGAADWIAFVDADVRLEPGSLAGLIAHAGTAGLDAVSPLLRQRCSGVADSLVVPLAFWQYTVGLPGGGQSRGRGILNGQCIVVRREAYARCGGHADARVRGSVIEDSALARRLLGSGARIGLVRGERLGEVAMYSSAAGLRAGFGKNAAAFLGADPRRGLLVAATGTAMTACLPLALRAAAWPTPVRLAAALAAWAPWALALAPRYRAARLPGALATLHPLTAAAMQAIAVEGLVRARMGRPPAWRGRPAAVL